MRITVEEILRAGSKPQPKDALTYEEWAARWGVGRVTARRIIREGVKKGLLRFVQLRRESPLRPGWVIPVSGFQRVKK